MASRCSSSAAISSGSSPKVCRFTRRARRKAPTTPSARPSIGGISVTGRAALSSELTSVSSTPTDTRPITWPCVSSSGTFARTERPSEPDCTPTKVRPASTEAGSSPGSPSSDVPMSAGFGWE